MLWFNLQNQKKNFFEGTFPPGHNYVTNYSINDTLTFPDLLGNAEESNDYDNVSYDFESLFTGIPVKETIGYIIEKVYVKKETKPFCI